MENNLLHQEDEAKFLETAVIFAHHAAEFLRNHRTYIANDDNMLVQLEYILRCVRYYRLKTQSLPKAWLEVA